MKKIYSIVLYYTHFNGFLSNVGSIMLLLLLRFDCSLHKGINKVFETFWKNCYSKGLQCFFLRTIGFKSNIKTTFTY